MPEFIGQILHEIYHRLYRQFGPQHWWPAETPFEVCVGAVLTQNTNWQNVEKAIQTLKQAGLLSPEALYALSEEELAVYIRPAGYFRIKARRLKNLVRFLVEEKDLETLKEEEPEKVRHELLKIKGIGPETADSILLNALEKPVFVVDAYTKRILLRHGLATESADYHQLQELFMTHLPPDPQLYNEYHALLVACGKTFCLSRRPRCSSCSLQGVER